MKKILVALVLVVLITASITLLSTPQVKADPSEVKILSYSWYIAPSNTVQAEYVGDFIVVGAVQNVGTNTLEKVVISGDAYNSTLGLVDYTDGQAFGNYLAPGQIAPFYLDFSPDNIPNADPSWASTITNVTLAVTYADDSNITMYSGLTIPSGGLDGSLSSTGTYTLSGFVQNTGTQLTGNVWVVTTFYNASGTVVSMNYTDYVSNSLAPGARASFVATPMDNTPQMSSSITNYSVLIQTEPLSTSPATPTAPPTTTEPTSTTTDSTHPTQSPTGAISMNSLTESVVAIVAVLIIVVVLVVLLLMRKRKKNTDLDLPPPPPPQ